MQGSQLRAVMLYESMVRDKVVCNAQTYAIMLVLHTRSEFVAEREIIIEVCTSCVLCRQRNWDAAGNILTQMESEVYMASCSMNLV